jgi:hypothetical protein
VLDTEAASPYADLDLRSKTLAKACKAILRAKGQPATSRELLDILVAEKKLAHGKNSSLVSVINALKRHSNWFSKQGSEWTLVPSLISKNGDGEKP